MSGTDARYPLLQMIACPQDMRRLPLGQLPALAEELRAFLLCQLSPRCPDAAAALETVELTIALHYAFDTPDDRLVWDGGQLGYAHKVLTGRRERLQRTRQPEALQPFPRRAESEYDAFGVGHASTSISAALGMAIAAVRLQKPRRVVAVIDAAGLTGGLAFEALNHAGCVPADLLVILNDRDASLPEGSGALYNHFARVLSGRVYAGLRAGGKKMLRPLPPVWELARRSEQHVKGMMLPGTLFEELGFNYIGPSNGDDIGSLVTTLRNVQRLRGPQLLHVVSRGGSGGAARVHTESGRPAASSVSGGASWLARRSPARAASYSVACARWLCDMAETDSRICVIAPALHEDSGLDAFAQRFPHRWFNVSVAQQHAVTFAAGLATAGLKPVVVIASTFLQRTYDQLIHDVALQRLGVIFAVERAGLVGGDGATHQGSHDLSYLRCIPNFTIMAPADENECRQMLYTASTLSGPAVVRYPCGNGPGVAAVPAMSALPIGRAQICREGHSGLALLAFGAPLEAARPVARRLDATLVNMRFVKPLDHELLAALCSTHRALVAIEDNAVAGGAGSAVGESLSAQRLGRPLLQLGIPDRFIEHSSREDCLAATGLDARGLSERIERWWSGHSTRRLSSVASAELVAAHQQPIGHRAQ